MMQIIKMSIVFMTTAIFVLVGLIIYKSFFDKSPSVSENTVIEINTATTNVQHFAFNEDEIAVMNAQGQIEIFSRASGRLMQEYKLVQQEN